MVTTTSCIPGGICLIRKKPSLFVEDPQVVLDIYTLTSSMGAPLDMSETKPEIEFLYSEVTPEITRKKHINKVLLMSPLLTLKVMFSSW
jgi:hypothetical protein